MIANDYSVSQLLAIGEDVVYVVPPYQREYKWGKNERDEFFRDILDNEMGYFLGSIICVEHKEQPLNQRWELVDGQQRMVTLSLMFAAIYSKLNECKELNDDQKNDLYNLKSQLVLKKNGNIIRVVPQIQNSNENDYREILAKAGVIQQHIDVLPNAGNRRISQAYKHFQNKLDRLLSQSNGNINILFEILEKINKSRLVMIDAGNNQGAYALFTALNDKGSELTAVDILKTTFFASIFAGNKEQDQEEIKRYSENWNHLVACLGDDDAVQERFFRQYYNAFRNSQMSDKKMNEIAGYSIATRSNLIRIYEKIIERDPEGFFKKIIDASRFYSILLGQYDKEDIYNLKKQLFNLKNQKTQLFDLKDLERIRGTPSYLLLLYLMERKNELKLDNEHLCNVVDYLVRFFVRRNLTDIPATRNLTPLFMDIIDRISALSDNRVVETIKQGLFSVSSNDEDFLKYLKGKIYSENTEVARFILCAIEENAGVSKEEKGLWEKKEGKQYVWTIDHILPQSLSREWMEMVADGMEDSAKKLQSEYVDLLGNLTLTGYNSELGDKDFIDKRDKEIKGKVVGYKNGLYLNKDLKDRDKWTTSDIEERTSGLVNETIKLFQLQ